MTGQTFYGVMFCSVLRCYGNADLCVLGVNPQTVRGSRTGVFIGCSASEAHEAWSNDIDHLAGYEMTGCTRSMFANRLSYFFDFKGNSFLPLN